MITLTRLSGSVFVLNADLIERVDSTPDTVITLVDGKKYVVADSMGQVVEAVIAYRAEIVAIGSLLETVEVPPLRAARVEPGPRLAAVAPHPTAAIGPQEQEEDADPVVHRTAVRPSTRGRH
jgi:flagellar protein FlbD